MKGNFWSWLCDRMWQLPPSELIHISWSSNRLFLITRSDKFPLDSKAAHFTNLDDLTPRLQDKIPLFKQKLPGNKVSPRPYMSLKMSIEGWPEKNTAAKTFHGFPWDMVASMAINVSLGNFYWWVQPSKYIPSLSRFPHPNQMILVISFANI